MKFVLLIVWVIQINSYEYWSLQYSAFTSDNIINNEGWWVQGNNGQLTSFCDGVSLFGGYNIFGIGAIVSKIISLPPHSKIRVSLEFWKIDSWDYEYLYILLDDYLQTGTWRWDSGEMLCGNPSDVLYWREDKINYVFEFMHNQPTLAVVITTNLDSPPYDESWGFRNFKVEVILCSPGCLMCNDDTPDECWYYGLVEKNWFEDFNFDGWMLDNQQSIVKSSCANIWVIGGVSTIMGSKQLQKQFTSLDAHYKIIMQVQLWKIDIWNNNQFQIEIDGQLSAQAVFNQFEIIQLCGDSSGGEKWINIQLEKSHTSDSLQVLMKSNVASLNGSWGLRAFSLFIVKCYQTCLVCSGPKINNCQACKTGYILHNSECVDVKWILGLKQYFQPQDFQAQNGWTIQNIQNNQSPFSTCSNTNLLGGLSLLSKDASITLNFDLPKHTKIRAKLEFWKFGPWNNTWFQVFADGIQVYQVQFGLNGVPINCGSFYPNVYKTNLDFEFPHDQLSINFVMTTTLNAIIENESWGIRDFQLLYGVPQDCSYSVIDSVSLPSFIGTKYIESRQHSLDQTLQNKIDIPQLGISLQANFDQTISVDSAIKKLKIEITWQCFLNDLTLSISILQSSYPDYKTVTTICKQQKQNIIKSSLFLERTITQESQIRLLGTLTSFQMFQIVEGQTTKQYEIMIN